MSEPNTPFPGVATHHAPLPAGVIVGGSYETVRIIGEGGMSRVYEARNVWTQRAVALKILNLPRGVEAKAKRRFVDEAKTAARLTHPNIVRVLDMGVARDGLLFIVQELVDGESLATCLTRLRRLTLQTALKIFVPILDALDLAHEHGFVHRDVTPNNILLAEQTAGYIVPKLTDFGVAKHIAADSVSRRITDDGTLLGTPLFMSPEQVRAEPDLDGRSDVWSVAACLYFAVTGRLPFEAPSLVELAARIIMAQPKPPSIRVAKLPTALDDIIMKALSKEREARHVSARHLRDELRALALGSVAKSAQIDVAAQDECRISSLLDSAPLPPFADPPPGSVGVAADVGSLRAASRARPLRVGMVVRNAEAHARVEEAFSQSLGIRCDVWCYFEYGELVDALSDRETEFAWLPPVAFVRARRSQHARLLLAVQRAGRSTYAGAILGRRGIAQDLAKIDRARAVWVDPWSAAGYVMPLVLLRTLGLSPESMFSSQAFLGSHDAVLDALVAGTADIGATHCSVGSAGEIVRKAWSEDDGLRVLGITGPIPGDTFCAAPGVSKTLRHMVSQALLDTDRASPVLKVLGASRMVEADPADYDALEAALLGERSSRD